MEKSTCFKLSISTIEEAALKYCTNSDLNTVKDYNSLKIFDLPIFGIASANDSMFDTLKEETVIGNHHLSPKEWLPEAKAVVSYFLPFSLEVRKANRIMGLPAKEWLYGRYEGEIFNNALREYLETWFRSRGYKSIAPSLD